MILKRLLKYLCTTLLGTATDTLVLWIFSHYVFAEYVGQVIISPMISFECAVMVNFTTAFFFVWKERIPSKTKRTFFGHLWKYNLSCLTAFAVKMLLLVGIEKLTDWDVVICNLLALCLSGLVNFTINEKVVFKKKNIMDKDEYRDD